ncbi:MAG: flagellar FlbD family protein [Candidatus Atribacteria bacterium]|nr:flagellar FlbD family protein [Candidatus Atribacteria bacterium]MCD6350139.1 flagellar FlbD family protein [Candidatus Atribacteria bacterium]HHF09121.1 flagellar protein FlbD [Candidatus Atribacteria bacterium]
MITVTRFNGSVFVVNSDLIETIEATPDTVITLVTGKKYVVQEKVEEIIEKIIEFRRRSGMARVLIQEISSERGKENG